ncbi:MAG: hypothetical protein ACKVP0_16000 [Pirellulaceae bacterium]
MVLVRLTAAFLLIALAASSAAAAEKNPVLAFTFTHADVEKAKVEPFPYFRIFPDGKDKSGADASSTLSTLKAARGQSALFKEEDANPGLIVVLRRILFIPLASGDFRAVFEGEFNAVQTIVKKATVDKLLGGNMTEIVFAGETTKGLRPLAFTIKPKTTFRMALKEGRLLLYGVDGESTIIHYGLTGTFTYESDKVKVEPADKESPVYIGKPTPPELKDDGEPITLPVIN